MTNFVVIEGRALRQAMKAVGAVVERRNTIPVLGCAKLTLTQSGLTVIGTDLDIEITAHLDVIDGEGEWSICLDAGVLSRISRIAGSMPLRITQGESRATITVGDTVAVYTAEIQAATDFPAIEGARGDMIEMFGNGLLAEMISKVADYMCAEETRYYLTGVCWQVREDGRRFVATDGHRLAACRYAAGDDEAQEWIIPRKTVKVAIDLLAGKDVKIFGVSSKRALDIVAPGLTIRAKLIDATFPDYRRVIPTGTDFVFVFKQAEIVAAIDAAAAITPDRMGLRGITFREDSGRVVIERKCADFGTSRVATSTEWPKNGKGPAEAFGVNSAYLRLMFKRCQGDITVGMIDKGSPFLVRDADTTMTRVIMPMRV